MGHLSHEELYNWNICHIYTFSKGNKWFKKCCAISNTHQFSSVPHDPITACKNADDCCCQNVILTGFHPSIKKKSQGTHALVTCSIIIYQHSNMFNKDVCIIHCCAHTVPGNKGQCTVIKTPLSQTVTQENDTQFVRVLHKHT